MNHLMGSIRCRRRARSRKGPTRRRSPPKTLPEQAGENQAQWVQRDPEKLLEFGIDMAQSHLASAEIGSRRNFCSVFPIISKAAKFHPMGARRHHLESSGERSSDATTQRRANKRQAGRARRTA